MSVLPVLNQRSGNPLPTSHSTWDSIRIIKNCRKFYQTRLIHEAITEDQAASEVPFYLTRSPYCSSRLKPNSRSLASFLFSDLFEVERETQVRATSLNAALGRLNLPTVDWIKL